MLTLACLATAFALGACALIADLGDRTLAEPPSGNEGGAETDAGGPGDDDGAIEGGCLRTPLNLTEPEMLLIVDTSGSMGLPTPSGPLRIEIERVAVVDFVRDPGSRKIFGALTFDPAPGYGMPAACPPPPYEKPVVPFGRLDDPDGGTAAAIIDNVKQAVSDGGSPWEGALRGTSVALKAHAASGGKPSLVFIADEAPTGTQCDTSTVELESVIADLARQTPSIRTYVVGLPATAAQVVLFDRLARAGGTGRKGASTSMTPDAPWLSAVLANIRDDLRCEVDLPGGTAFDPAKTTLTLAASGGDVPLAEVTGGSACAKSDAFFRLRSPGDGGAPVADDAAPPPDPPNGRARLCPTSCKKALAGAGVLSVECK